MVVCELGEGEVGAAFAPPQKTGLFSRVPKVRVSQWSRVFLVLRDGLDCQEAEPGEGGVVAPDGRDLVVLSRGAFDFEMSFPSVKVEDGHPWDVVLRGRFVITEPALFAERLGPGWLGCGRRLRAEAVSQLARNIISHHVAEEMATCTFGIEDLKSGRVHPKEWWDTQLGKWLSALGCRWEVEGPAEWKSASAEAAQAEAERRRAAEERLERLKEEQSAQQEILRIEAETEEARRQIEHVSKISEFERRQRLLLLEHEAELKRKEAEARLKRAQWRLDELALEHEMRMAELAGRRDEAAKQKEVLKELRQQNERTLALAEEHHKELRELCTTMRALLGGLAQEGRQRHEALVSALSEIKATLAASVQAGRLGRQEAEQQHEQLMAVLAEIRDALADGQRDRAEAEHRLVELMVSPDLGFSVHQLRALGFDTTLEEFIGMVCAAAKARGTVRLRMPSIRLQTRDVMMCRRDQRAPQSAEVPVLHIGGRLDMELEVARGGYATLLNFGTSGSVWLCVPNVACAPGQARVEPGRVYHLPGCHLLPARTRAGEMELREVGPVGREHMMVVVSREPLIGADLAERIEELRSQGGLPFLRLSPADVAGLDSRLKLWDDDSWDAAVLSFDVVR